MLPPNIYFRAESRITIQPGPEQSLSATFKEHKVIQFPLIQISMGPLGAPNSIYQIIASYHDHNCPSGHSAGDQEYLNLHVSEANKGKIDYFVTVANNL